MANQLNFVSPITTMVSEKMSRLTPEDNGLVVINNKSILFGTTPEDNVELWFYNPDGTYYSHTKLYPEDPALSLSTIVNSDGAQEVLNIDFDAVSLAARLAPGRYSVSIYVLRDVAGELDGEKFIIKEISPSRTEIKITPPVPSAWLFHQIYNFVVPSVPAQYAKALLDEIFAKSLDFNPDWTESLNGLDVSRVLNIEIPKTTDRIVEAEAETSFVNLFTAVKDRTYSVALELLIERTKEDWNVQHVELRNIILKSLESVLAKMIDAKEIDPRFRLI